MTDIYLVTMSPKRDYRNAHHYIVLLSARSAKNALSKTPAEWPIGDGAYTNPRAFKVGDGFKCAL